jgi:hypothetical protein
MRGESLISMFTAEQSMMSPKKKQRQVQVNNPIANTKLPCLLFGRQHTVLFLNFKWSATPQRAQLSTHNGTISTQSAAQMTIHWCNLCRNICTITISAVVYQSSPEINAANFNKAVWLDIVTCSLGYGGTVSFVTYVT